MGSAEIEWACSLSLLAHSAMGSIRNEPSSKWAQRGQKLAQHMLDTVSNQPRQQKWVQYRLKCKASQHRLGFMRKTHSESNRASPARKGSTSKQIFAGWSAKIFTSRQLYWLEAGPRQLWTAAAQHLMRTFNGTLNGKKSATRHLWFVRATGIRANGTPFDGVVHIYEDAATSPGAVGFLSSHRLRGITKIHQMLAESPGDSFLSLGTPIFVAIHEIAKAGLWLLTEVQCFHLACQGS